MNYRNFIGEMMNVGETRLAIATTPRIRATTTTVFKKITNRKSMILKTKTCICSCYFLQLQNFLLGFEFVHEVLITLSFSHPYLSSIFFFFFLALGFSSSLSSFS